jgi:hypothetical protein
VPIQIGSVLLNAGHFAWADAADDYARLLINWWGGGYEQV